MNPQALLQIMQVLKQAVPAGTPPFMPDPNNPNQPSMPINTGFRAPQLPMGMPSPAMTGGQMGVQPSVPGMPIGVTPGQVTSGRSIGYMTDDELLQQLDAEYAAQDEARKKQGAPSKAKKPTKKSPNLPLAALLIAGLLESIQRGSGQQGLQGYMSGQNMKLDKKYEGEAETYNSQIQTENDDRNAAALESQIRGDSIGRIQGMLSSRSKAGAEGLDFTRDMAKIEATFKGREGLAGINNEADWKQKLLDVFKNSSPDFRASLSKELGFDPLAAGAMKPGEKLQTAKTEEIKLLLPHRVKKAIAEGRGAELKNSLTEANTRLQKLRGDAEAVRIKWLPGKLAAETRKISAQADKALKDSNDAVASVIGKPATGTAILNAINKIDEADTAAEAALAKLSHESASLNARIADLRSGKDKSVTGGMVEIEIKKVQDALEANEAVQEYYKVIRTRNKERRQQVVATPATAPSGLPSSSDIAGTTQKKTVIGGI